MSTWRATMPKGNPPTGKVYVVFAFKEPSGARAEIRGEYSAMKIKMVLKLMNMTDEQIIYDSEGCAA